MKSLLRYIVKGSAEPKALVLMYHRVAHTGADIWEMAVSPSNFEQQLQVLKNEADVVPLSQLAEAVSKRSIKKKSIAITFDDGYLDNYQVARPLLEKYGLPATFFITSCNIDQNSSFWWDELEHLLLYSERLPNHFSLTVGNTPISMNLAEEAQLNDRLSEKISSWKACDEPAPTLRCELFYKVWENLKPLPHPVLQHQLRKVREWAATAGTVCEAPYRSMSSAQVRELASNNLFEIAAHTFSHPGLAFHDLQFQKQEMVENKKHLQAITGQEVSLLSYPYGDYNQGTVAAAAAAGFKAAFTTEERAVKDRSDRYLLGRYQVKNWEGREFGGYLKKWLKQKQT